MAEWLTEEAFATIVDTGCSACRSKAVVVEAIVARRIPLHGGEPFGAPSWAYKGEDLVRGAYRVACAECKHEMFEATACPRCQRPGGIEHALTSDNTFPLPTACAKCEGALLTAMAFVPATVGYDGKIAKKATTQTAPEDPGFHAFRVECNQCHEVLERRTPCPMCG